MKKYDRMGTAFNLVSVNYINILLLTYGTMFDVYTFTSRFRLLDMLNVIVIFSGFIMSPVFLISSFAEKIKRGASFTASAGYILFNLLVLFSLPLVFIIKFNVISMKLFLLPLIYVFLYSFSGIIIYIIRKKSAGH